MKFEKAGQVLLVSAIALVLATLFTACGTLTVDFLFVATNKQSPGQIEVYEVDSESGTLRTIPTSPFPSGGRDPVAEATSPNAKNLYVVNEDDNNIVQFGIGTDGKLYPQSTINTPGSFPVQVAVNAAGTFLFVTDILQPVAGCSLTNPCPGDVAVYPIDPASGALGSPVANAVPYPTYWPLLLSPADSRTVLTPTGINVLANGNTVYVSAYNPSANIGYIFGFAVASSGALTLQNNGLPLVSGVHPVAMASDSSSSYLYVVDAATDSVASYAVQSGGALSLQSTAATGGLPSAIALSTSGVAYVANSVDSNVTSYSISSGNLARTSTNASDNDPIALILDPRQVGFLYTVNFLGNSLSGFKVDPSSGALTNTKNSPYPSTVQPTAIAGIAHKGSSK